MTEELVDRVHAAARAVVGITTTTELGEVRQIDLDRYAVSVDGSIVGGSARAGSLALYLSSVLAWSAGPAEGDLLPDGNAPDPFSGVDVSGLRLMAGGQELTFHRDLRTGVPITLETSLTDAQVKEGGAGRMVIITLDRRYFDPEGLLTECRERFLGLEEVQ